MGPSLVLIIPFADSDPTPYFAKGALELPTCVQDAVNLIDLFTDGEDVTTLSALCPDPVGCSELFAPSLLESVGTPTSPEALAEAQGEIQSQMELWPGLTLKAFGLAASIPTLLWDGDEPLVSDHGIDLEAIKSNPTAIMQYLRVAIVEDKNRDLVLPEAGTTEELDVPDIVIHPDGGLGLLDELEGQKVIQPIKVECTTFFPSSNTET